MNDSTSKKRLFDIQEYSDKVKTALSNLESTQQPGQISGKGSKTDVLLATKKEIYELIKKGYTAKQIADALSNDIFGILPKTITQLVSNKQVKVTAKSRHTPPPPSQENAQRSGDNVVNNQGKKPITEINDVD